MRVSVSHVEFFYHTEKKIHSVTPVLKTGNTLMKKTKVL